MSNIDPKEQAFEEMAEIEKFIDQASTAIQNGTPLLAAYAWCSIVAREVPYVGKEELYTCVLEAAGLVEND